MHNARRSRTAGAARRISAHSGTAARTDVFDLTVGRLSLRQFAALGQGMRAREQAHHPSFCGQATCAQALFRRLRAPPLSAVLPEAPLRESRRVPTRDMRVTAVISIRCPGSLRSHGIRPINRRRARAGSLLPVIRSALPRRTVYITMSMLSGRTKTRHSDIIPSGERSSSAQYIRAFASAMLVSGTVIPPARFDRLSHRLRQCR